MKITLIDYTGAGNPDPWYAADLLIYAKSTRVEMSPDGLAAISKWPEEKKMAELEYAANTIRSSWEYVNFTFMLEGVTRSLTHQLVRTRTASFSQQTMQILKMTGFTAETPDFLRKYGDEFQDLSMKKGIGVYDHNEKSSEMQAIWDSTIQTIRQAYDRLIEIGATVEEARGLLPHAIHTNIVAQYNLRTLVDLFHTRISPRNLGEFREVAEAMRAEVLKVHPWAKVFLARTTDAAMADMDDELIDLRRREPEKATKMLKLVDQLRRGS